MLLIQWFFFGILFTVASLGISYLSLKVTMKWWGWATIISGVGAILFGLAWAGASFEEGVAQSGSMALIFFCGTGLLMLGMAWRFWIQPQLANK